MTALYDNVSRHVVEIDMIQMNGPDFSQVDNRLLSLQLVKRGYTDAVISALTDRTSRRATRCTRRTSWPSAELPSR
jgi:hypothetical protein